MVITRTRSYDTFIPFEVTRVSIPASPIAFLLVVKGTFDEENLHVLRLSYV